MQVGELEEGDAGTDRTLREMARLAREAVPFVPDWYPHTPRAIRAFLSDRMRFRPDPPGAEVVYHPLDLLDDIRRDGVAYGDCDDAAALGAALGVAAGHLVRFRVVGFSKEGPFAHVWAELVDSRTGSIEDLDIFRPRELPTGSVIRREATVEV